MIAVDTNILVYAHRPDLPLHAAAARCVFLPESESHLATLGPLIRAADLRGGQVHDARIAAICLGHGVRELWSCDRDFSQFPSLRLRNPLIQT